jgi:hypothetical protein
MPGLLASESLDLIFKLPTQAISAGRQRIRYPAIFHLLQEGRMIIHRSAFSLIHSAANE